MRTAAIDLGKARIGLAVSDELGLLAHPRPFVEGRDPGRAIGRLAELATSEGIEHFVVGLPVHLDGKEGVAARRARRFAERLAAKAKVRVTLIDERLSTVEARARLREQGLSEIAIRKRVDSAAAAILLQSYLDGQRERES